MTQQTEALPRLPEPVAWRGLTQSYPSYSQDNDWRYGPWVYDLDPAKYRRLFTEEQMHAYASAAISSQPASRDATVEQSIVQLVNALAASKGWMRGYADSIVRDAIDRAHLLAKPVAMVVSDVDDGTVWNELQWLTPLDSLAPGTSLFAAPPNARPCEQAALPCRSIPQCNHLAEQMDLIADIAAGSTTANSLPHIEKIARASLTATAGSTKP